MRHFLHRHRQHLPVSPPLEGRLFDILMDTTSACQLRCVMCPQSLPHAHRQADVMDEATIRRIVEEVVPHANSLALSCVAEPMMNPHFSLLLELLEGSGLPSSSMVTNGMYLPDAIIERIIAARVSVVSFSLDSPVAREYESIRSGARLSRVTASIQRLRQTRDRLGSPWPSITLNCVLMRRNIRSLPQLIELGAELGAAEIDLRHVLPIGGLEMEKQSLISKAGMAAEYLDQAEVRARELNIKLHAPPRFADSPGAPSGLQAMKQSVKGQVKKLVLRNLALPRCSQPWRQLMIHPNGELYPCTNWIYDPASAEAQILFPPVREAVFSSEEYCLGNLRAQSFQEIFEGASWRRLREELTGRQALKPLCRRCPLRLSQGGQLFDPAIERVNVSRKWKKHS